MQKSQIDENMTWAIMLINKKGKSFSCHMAHRVAPIAASLTLGHRSAEQSKVQRWISPVVSPYVYFPLLLSFNVEPLIEGSRYHLQSLW